jgi:hypothetical protein
MAHPQHHHPPTADPAGSASFSIHGGVQALVAGLSCGDDHPALHRRLADKAWSVLLDLDPANAAGLPEVAPHDRPAANARAAEQV